MDFATSSPSMVDGRRGPPAACAPRERATGEGDEASSSSAKASNAEWPHPVELRSLSLALPLEGEEYVRPCAA